MYDITVEFDDGKGYNDTGSILKVLMVIRKHPKATIIIKRHK